MNVGIDLGTTYSSVAYIDDSGNPEIIKNGKGSVSTPSIVAFKDGKVFFGEDARDIQVNGTGLSASAFKRSMGKEHPEITIDGKGYTAEDLSSMLLKHLVEDAAEASGKKIDAAVITVPAYFNDLQRKSTERAARNAGIEVLRIVNEPTAAALYYGIRENTDRRIVVYDLGGGTFDVTLFEIKGGKMKVIGTYGNSRLGGKDWDYKLMDYVLDQFEDDFGIKPKSDILFWSRFLVEIERYKCQLSSCSSVDIEVEYQGHSGTYTVDRSDLNMQTEGLVRRTMEICSSLLRDVGMRWSDFDEVLLTGGSTRIPAIGRKLRDVTGIEVVSRPDADVAVAKGAALFSLQCALPGGKSVKKLIDITDVTAHSLGMVSVSSDHESYINEIILRKNTPVPCSRKKPFRINPKDRSGKLDIYVVQGEPKEPLRCTIVSKTEARGIVNTEDGVDVEVQFAYSRDGLVEIKAFQDDRPLEVRELPVPEDISWMDGKPGARVTGNPQKMHICIAMDISTSMMGAPILKTVDSVTSFIRRFPEARYSVIFFADRRTVAGIRISMDSAIAKIREVCDSLGNIKTNIGYANAWSPFGDIKSCLTYSMIDEMKVCIVLTDGVWKCMNENPILASKECMDEGIRVIALGFGTADPDFIKKISNTDVSGLTDVDGMMSTFESIATVIEFGIPMLMDD